MRVLLLAGLSLLLCQSVFAQNAPTLQELVAADRLRVSLVLDTSAPIYQRLPVVLSVEIATRNRFSRGTRVRDFRIENAVTLPFSSFADNQSRLMDGATWTVQRWRFRVFPQLPGILTVPPLKVFVSVKDGASNTIEGDWDLAAREVNVIVPPGAPPAGEPWLAARSLQVREDWSGEADSYLPGDAVTRTRRFVAGNAPAMMLVDTQPPRIDGLSLYAAPPEVEDSSNRGTITGSRKEILVITFEKPGTYRIPGTRYQWFNTDTQRFATLALQEKLFEVQGSATVEASRLQAEAPRAWLRWLAWLSSAIVLLAMGAALARTDVMRAVSSVAREQAKRRQRRRAYARAVRRADARRALSILREHAAGPGQTDLLAATQDRERPAQVLRQLLAAAYGTGGALPELAEALELYAAFDGTRLKLRRVSAAAENSLSLNPGASGQKAASAL